jgi:hypothetical protein
MQNISGKVSLIDIGDDSPRKGGYDKMAGLMVFKSLADALRAGFQIYDRTSDGYLVRTRTSNGWAIALVACKQ